MMSGFWTEKKNEQETQQERSNRKSQRIPDGFFVFKKKHMLNQHKQTELRGQHVRYNVIMSTKNVH